MGSSWGSFGGCSGSLGAVWVSLGVPLAALTGSWGSLLGVLGSLGFLLDPQGSPVGLSDAYRTIWARCFNYFCYRSGCLLSAFSLYVDNLQGLQDLEGLRDLEHLEDLEANQDRQDLDNLEDLQAFCSHLEDLGDLIGTKYLLPSTWYQVLGTKYLVPRTLYMLALKCPPQFVDEKATLAMQQNKRVRRSVNS